MALNLRGSLSGADKLAAYGDAGKLLAAHPLRRRDELPAGITVVPASTPGLQPARRIQGEVPELPLKLREVSVPKWLHLQAVVDEQGRLRDPVAVSPLSGMVYEILEAVRSWRFEPAHKDGKPVATLYELTVNPPAEVPLTTIAPLQGDLAEIEGLLRAQRWEEAGKKGDALWTRAVDRADPSRAYLAVTLALRALAEAGSHREDDGICRWQAAQALEPRLYHADLSAYGAPGALLEHNRWGRQTAEPDVQRVTSPTGPKGAPGDTWPEIVTQTKPQYTEIARRSGVQGAFVLATIIDQRGVVQDPVVVSGPAVDPKGLDAASLEAICGWRFKPAMLAGRPVRVYYVLTINYGIGHAPPVTYVKGTEQLLTGFSPWLGPEPFPPPVRIPLPAHPGPP